MVKTNKQKFNERYNQPSNKANSKKDISKLTGISMSILDKVYDRGLAAHKNNPGSVRNVRGVKGGGGPKMSAQQWAQARVYSFAVGGTTRRTADRDLWEKHKSKKK
jgi:hypothetical protein